MSRARRTHTAIAMVAALIIVGTATPVLAAGPPPGPGQPTIDPRPARPAWDHQAPDDGTRLIVEFRSRTPVTARRASISAVGSAQITDLPAAHAAVVKVAATRSAEAMAALRADPNVLRVSVDHRRFRALDPRAETWWAEQWALHNTGQNLFLGTQPGGTSDVDIDGLQALGLTTGSPSTVVAVIDDGVDFSHPDLAGRAWTNPGESGAGKDTNGVDDDANGYIDDVHGWDFCHDDNTVHDFDDDFHGTHVAGTIAASLNGIGIVGVAPNVSIMALKFINNGVTCGFDSQAIAAIAYAKSFGVRISNNSWSGPGNRSQGQKMGAPALYDAIASSGMLFVAAAGNEGIDNDTDANPALPAAFDLPNILAVAAIDSNGGLADFSNVGHTSVDIAAPGVDILSSLPAETGEAVGWGWLNGTSMASPHVAGTAALVASISPSLAADPIALKARILATGKSMPLTVGDTVGGKVVDAYRALDATAPTAHTPNSHGFVLGSALGKSTASVKVGWPAASDALSGVSAYGVQVQANGGAWTTVTGSTASRTANRVVSFGPRYAFRVRARDAAGNWGAFVSGPVVEPRLYQETSSLVAYHGTWKRSNSTAASGGRTRYATRAGASATFHFNGRGFAVVMPKGSTRGSAKLYVDGGYVATLNLRRPTTASRILVATGWWTSSGAHTVKLVVVGNRRVDIDAFAVMR